MILADASVLVQALRGDAKLKRLVTILPIAICGVTESEMLAGARSAADLSKLEAVLAGYLNLPFPGDIWNLVGRNLATLYGVGLTIPFPDVTVATLGIAAGVEVWARDKHFPTMAAHLPGLRLFAEP